jgi:UDP-3-O-[3-hydroxymyristoyl] glucosamine N-acyltransferase
MLTHINNNSKPLIFLGSNSNLYKLTQVCTERGIKVAGIIDSDYYGNTEEICGVPVIASQECFNNAERLQYYRTHYNFFCATNWMPMTDAVTARNRQKRSELIALIEQYNLECVSLINPRAEVSPHAIIGRNVYVDCFVLVEACATLCDYSSVYAYTGVGHHSTIGRNSIVQRHVSLTGSTHIGADVYVSIASKLLKGDAVISDGTFIQEGITLHRGTVPNEVVSLTGINTRRVTSQYQEIT